MKKIMFLALAGLISILLTAQSSTITWGKPGNFGTIFSVPSFTVAMNDSYFTLGGGKKITQYNLSHLEIGQKPFEPKYDGKKLTIKSVVKTKNFVFLTHDSYPGKKQRQSLVTQMDKSGNLSAPKLLSTVGFGIDITNYFNALSNLTSIGFLDNETFVSPNKEIIANMCAEISAPKDAKKAVWGITVLDENMNVKWSRKQEFPYEKEKMQILSHDVTDDGEVLALAWVSQKGKKLFIITKSDFKELDVLLGEGQYVTDAVVKAKEDGSVFIGGIYYTNNNTQHICNIEGWFASYLDLKQMTISKPVTYVLGSKVIDNLPSQGDKAVGSRMSYGLFGAYTLQDGNVAMVVDRQYSGKLNASQASKSTGLAGPAIPLTFYHSDEKLVVSFDKDLKKNFDLAVPNKYASPSSLEYINPTIKIFGMGDKIAMIYLKSEINEQSDLQAKGITKKEDIYTPSYYAIIDSKGEVLRKNISFQESEKRLLSVPNVDKIDNTRILVNWMLGSKFEFGILSVAK